MLKALFNKKSDINSRVYAAQKGNKAERERLINDYKPFIINILCKACERYIEVENADEVSVGLIAFNEAIDKYDKTKAKSFLYFAEQVIKNRLIDYFRKEKNHAGVIPISYLEERFECENLEEKYFTDFSQSDSRDVKEEMADFKNSLNYFGITIEDLVQSSPKHIDTRINAVKIAQYLSTNDELLKKLRNSGKLPIAELHKQLNISRKVLEKNRKYIIAVCMILHSDNEIMKGYIYNLLKEVK